MSLFKNHDCLDKVQIVGCPDPFKDKVKCEECKHWIDKSDASTVKHIGSIYGVHTSYYCSMHKKPYTRFLLSYPTNIYYGEVLMEEDGTPVGYQKIKEPKS